MTKRSRFRPQTKSATLEQIALIPQGPAGDAELLDLLSQQLRLSQYATIIRGQMARRPNIYEELQRLLHRIQSEQQNR